MSEVLYEPRVERLDALRAHLRTLHESGYSDVTSLGQFIAVYNDFSAAIAIEEHEQLLVSLDIPEHDIEFDEGVFDSIVEAYDKLTGPGIVTPFADTGRTPSNDWGQELADFQHIFSEDYRQAVGKFHVDVLHGGSHAKYVKEHYEELKAADPDTARYYSLLGNPHFLGAIKRVFIAENTDADTAIDSDGTSFEKEFVTDILHACGYAYADTYDKDWSYVGQDDEARTTIAANIEHISALEHERPGIVKLLSGPHYGIRHFSRYPKQLLIDQFDKHGIADRPYGVFLAAASDHNGAFISTYRFDNERVPFTVFEAARATHDIKACEAGSNQEFIERLKALHSLYGDSHRISFAIIDAHGNPEHMNFGGLSALGKTALRTGFKNSMDIFTDDACVMIASCKTGKPGGIAQEFSRQFSTMVIAPEAVVEVDRIAFAYDGTVRLSPHFTVGKSGKEPIANMYKNGDLIGQA